MVQFEYADAVKFSVHFILSWIAASDGIISDKEKQVIIKTFGEISPGDMEATFRDIEHRDVTIIQSVCRMCTLMTQQQKEMLLELALLTALSDGTLAIPEIHILYLLIDALGFDHNKLDENFQRITGKDFPKPSDISEKTWWEQRSRNTDSKQKESTEDQKVRNFRTSGMNRIKALSVLGLEDAATTEDIKTAYRRLANVHHPDKFHSLGNEAVEVRQQHSSELMRPMNI